MTQKDLDEILAIETSILEVEIKRRLELVSVLDEIAKRALMRVRDSQSELENARRRLSTISHLSLTRGAEASENSEGVTR